MRDGRIVEVMEVVGVEGSRVLFERYLPLNETVLKRHRVAFRKLEVCGGGPRPLFCVRYVAICITSQIYKAFSSQVQVRVEREEPLLAESLRPSS